MALSLALIGVVFVLTPSYLGLAPGSYLSDAILSVGIAFWIHSTAGFLIEFGDLRSFMSGVNEEGWTALLGTLLFLIPAGICYLGVRLLDFPGWLDVVIKLASVPLLVLGAFTLAITLDSFFIRPRVEWMKSSREERRAKPRRQTEAQTGSSLGSIATAATWISTNVVNFLVILDQLFGK